VPIVTTVVNDTVMPLADAVISTVLSGRTTPRQLTA